MSRATLKYLLAALLFVDFSSTAILGLLLAFVIPSGNVSHEARVFLGLHRHNWADIHLTFSIILLGLITWRVWLSRDWVAEATKKLSKHQPGFSILYCIFPIKGQPNMIIISKVGILLANQYYTRPIEDVMGSSCDEKRTAGAEQSGRLTEITI